MNDNHPTDSQAKELLNKTPEETNCYKALHCLNIAVESSVADDVSEKVKAYINQLQAERDALKVEYESRAIWIRTMCDIIGYNNDDGFHSTPDPFDIAKRLVEAQATNPKPPEVAGMKKVDDFDSFRRAFIYALDDDRNSPIGSRYQNTLRWQEAVEAIQQDAYLAGQAASEKEVMELRKDKERLDWLENNSDFHRIDCNLAFSTPFRILKGFQADAKVISCGVNLREAIDQALTQNNTK